MQYSIIICYVSEQNLCYNLVHVYLDLEGRYDGTFVANIDY